MLARILLLSAAIASAADLDQQISARMSSQHVPGASVAVIDGGKLVWARGYGVTAAENGKPVNAETLFQAASISKHVAALIALHLVDEGKLSLDEDVNRKLRSWKVPENEFTRTEKVTLRRLLNHSAGLTVHGFPGYAAGEPVPTLVELLDGKKPANTEPIRVDIVPGTKWRYSGGGYEVAQQLILDVAGKPFPQLAREIVFGPLAMTRSTFEQPLPGRLEDNAASGHLGNGAVIKGRWHTYPELAAAGLWTTPSDLARIMIELQTTGGHVLKPETERQMLTKVLGDYGLGLGLGDKDGQKSFSHGGSNAGFQCLMVALQDRGKGVIIMTNSDRGGALANEVMRLIATEYGWGNSTPK
jgi:CubicO group peptidase (beta-lactamase class C family)